MNIGDRIKKRRKDLNKTLEDIGNRVGVTRATIQRYENGNIVNIPSDKIELLAKALETTPAYLMGWEDNINLKNIPGVIPVKNIKKIPILGRIVCGEPILSYQNIEGYFATDPDYIDSDFSLIAEGDSMIEAGINDGDLVFFKKTPYVENGSIAAVLIGDETTLKKFYKQKDSIILQPQNSDYPPIIITGDKLKETIILGEMVGVYSKRNK